MLPDWPSIKKELDDLLMAGVELRRYEMAPMTSRIGHRIYHEGTGGILVREDGEEDPMDLKTTSAQVDFEGAELGTIPLRDVFERYRKLIGEISHEQEATLVEAMKEAVDKTGNTVDAEGRKFGPDLILDVFEKVRVSFDSDGMPLWPTFFIGENAGDAMQDAIEKLEEEPYRSRLAEITERKKREWLDRESRRKLVD